MGQKVVGTAPKDDHLALLAGTGRVPQPWFFRVVMLKLYPLVLADTINPGITQGLLVRGESSKEEQVIRGDGGQGMPRSAHGADALGEYFVPLPRVQVQVVEVVHSGFPVSASKHVAPVPNCGTGVSSSRGRGLTRGYGLAPGESFKVQNVHMVIPPSRKT